MAAANAVSSTSPLEAVLARLRNHGCNPRQARPGQWTSKCPVASSHRRGDRNPSLSISEGPDGKALVCCHSGCTTPDVARALDLKLVDLFPPRPTTAHIARGQRVRATYDYYDDDGTLVFQVVRLEPKSFRQRQPDGRGDWLWHTRGIDRRPLYQLPQLRAAIDAGQQVWIVEGEKDAENLQWHVEGAVTTNSGGAGKWRPEYDEQLTGARRVTIIHDADDKGLEHARLVARHVLGLGALVTVLSPPDGCKDVSEALAYERTVDDFTVAWESSHGPAWLDGVVEPTPDELDDQADDDEPAPFGLTASLINWSDFWSRDLSAEEWLAEPFLARGRGHAVYAGAKTGKSYVVLAVCAALATGRAVLGRPAAAPVDVLYVDYEMTEEDLRERLEEFGYDASSDLSHLHYALLPSVPPLDTEAGGMELVMAAEAVGAEVVVIDTTGRAVSGSENENDTYLAFYRCCGQLLKRRRIAYVRIDHAGKDITKGQRGASAKNDDVDVVWKLARRDGDAMRFDATHSRMSWVRSFDALKVEGDDGVTFTTAERTDPTGTHHVVRKLDELGVPLDVSQRKARQLVLEHGIKASTDAIRAALRWRRQHASEAGIELLAGVEKRAWDPSGALADDDDETGEGAAPGALQTPTSEHQARSEARKARTSGPPRLAPASLRGGAGGTDPEEPDDPDAEPPLSDLLG